MCLKITRPTAFQVMYRNPGRVVHPENPKYLDPDTVRRIESRLGESFPWLVSGPKDGIPPGSELRTPVSDPKSGCSNLGLPGPPDGPHHRHPTEGDPRTHPRKLRNSRRDVWAHAWRAAGGSCMCRPLAAAFFLSDTFDPPGPGRTGAFRTRSVSPTPTRNTRKPEIPELSDTPPGYPARRRAA